MVITSEALGARGTSKRRVAYLKLSAVTLVVRWRFNNSGPLLRGQIITV